MVNRLAVKDAHTSDPLTCDISHWQNTIFDLTVGHEISNVEFRGLTSSYTVD